MNSKLTITLLLLTALCIQTAAAQSLEISYASGDYEIKKSGETEFTQGSGVGEILSSEDAIKSAGSYVQIDSPGDGRIVLGPGTEILFREMQLSPGTFCYIPFEIYSGIVLVEGEYGECMTSVKTPHFIMEMGSTVILDVTDMETTVYVVEGEVPVFELYLAPMFTISSGRMVIGNNETITSPYPYDTNYVQQLISEFDYRPSLLGGMLGMPIDVFDPVNPWFYLVWGAIAVVLVLVVYKIYKRRQQPF